MINVFVSYKVVTVSTDINDPLELITLEKSFLNLFRKLVRVIRNKITLKVTDINGKEINDLNMQYVLNTDARKRFYNDFRTAKRLLRNAVKETLLFCKQNDIKVRRSV